MDMSRLCIFDPEFPEDTSYEIRFEKSSDYLVIEGSELDIGNNVVLSIYCSVMVDTLAYTFALKCNGQHLFSVMGFKKSVDTPDPCIMYTVHDGRVFQITFVIE